VTTKLYFILLLELKMKVLCGLAAVSAYWSVYQLRCISICPVVRRHSTDLIWCVRPYLNYLRLSPPATRSRTSYRSWFHIVFIEKRTPVTRSVESIWNVMAHCDTREGNWRGNWWMEWVASTFHTTSEHGVSSITTADAHTSPASSRLTPPAELNWLVLFAERRNLVSARVPSHFKLSLLRAGWPGLDCRKGQRFVHLPPHPNRHWVSPSLLSDGYRGVSALFSFLWFYTEWINHWIPLLLLKRIDRGAKSRFC
jgi:hypothetical protein